MSTATNGRAREHRVRDRMGEDGWRQVMRAAGSKGSADLLMVHPEHGPALVQVGTLNKRLGPVDRMRFVLDATECGALPLVAMTGQGRFELYVATLDVPSKWERWDA